MDPSNPVPPPVRLKELLAISDRDRSEEEWDELIELEIMLAPENRVKRDGGGGGGGRNDGANRSGPGNNRRHSKKPGNKKRQKDRQQRRQPEPAGTK